MPEINTVEIRFNPTLGSVKADSFRAMFYTERWDDIDDTLRFLTGVYDVTGEIAGEVLFTDAEGEPPELHDLRYRHITDRRANGDPFDRRSVTLWPATDTEQEDSN